MKNIIVILFLFVLSARPAFYVGQIAYYNLNVEYITDVYCVNKAKPELSCKGKCHLAEQLQVAGTTDEDNGVNPATLIQAFFPVFKSELKYNYFKAFVFADKKLKVVDTYNNNYNYLLNFKKNKPPTVII